MLPTGGLPHQALLQNEAIFTEVVAKQGVMGRKILGKCWGSEGMRDEVAL